MKKLLAIAGSLVIIALLLPAQAQTPATTHDNPTPATKRKPAAGASPSQTVGQKFMEKSKPDARPIKLQPRPVRKD